MSRITLLYLLVAFLSKALAQLVMVQEIFRHGARYPIFPELLDPSAHKDLLENIGQLSRQGKRMHFLLGKKLYTEYWHKLFPNMTTLDSNLFYVKSTDFSRTIQSAQSHLMGLFDALDPVTLQNKNHSYSVPHWNPQPNTTNDNFVFSKTLGFKPIAIHVQQGGSNGLNRGDPLKLYEPENCPQQHRWSKQNYQSNFSELAYRHPRVKQSLAHLSEILNYKQGMNMTLLKQHYDTYLSQKYLEVPYLSVFQQQYKSEYEFLHAFNLYVELFNTDVQINTTFTLLLNATLQNFYNLTRGNTTSRFIIYSAHDTTVANALAGYRLTSAQCIYKSYVQNKKHDTCISEYPPFTANLIIEFHKDNDSYFIMLRYNGEYKKIPFCDYSLKCSLAQYQKFVDETINPLFMDTCDISKYDAPSQTHPAALAFAAILVVSSLGITLLVIYILKVKAFIDNYGAPTVKPQEKDIVIRS